MRFLNKLIDAVLNFFDAKDPSKEETEFLKWISELIKEDVL